jgi:hypothetical protein
MTLGKLHSQNLSSLPFPFLLFSCHHRRRCLPLCLSREEKRRNKGRKRDRARKKITGLPFLPFPQHFREAIFKCTNIYVSPKKI